MSSAHESANLLRAKLDAKNKLTRDRNLVNTELARLSKEYHDGLPIARLVALIEAHDFLVPPEEYAGIYCGDQGRCAWEIYHHHVGRVGLDQADQRGVCVIAWYRMPSGRFEVTAYLS